MLKELTGYSKIKRVYLEIISLCNFRCLHCFQGESLDISNLFSIDQCSAILTKFKEEFASTEVVILGGEPFLHPELHHILEVAKQLGYAPIEVCTNGYHITDRLKNIIGLVDELRVSLDGLEDSHNTMRKSDSFSEAIKTIKEAQNLGLFCSVTTTVTRQNITEIVDMCRMLLSIGVSKMKLHQIHLDGNAAKNPHLEPYTEQLKQLHVDLEECQKIGMTLLVDADLTSTGAKMFFTTEGNDTLDRVEVQPDGRMYLSCKALGTLHNAFWYDKEENIIMYLANTHDEIQEPVHQVHYL